VYFECNLVKLKCNACSMVKITLQAFCLYYLLGLRQQWDHYVFGLSVCPPSVCPLTPISRDTISRYFVDEFQWSLSQIFITCVREIAQKIVKVRGQRSRSERGQMHFPGRGIAINSRPSVRCASGGGIQIDGVATKLICFVLLSSHR